MLERLRLPADRRDHDRLDVVEGLRCGEAVEEARVGARRQSLGGDRGAGLPGFRTGRAARERQHADRSKYLTNALHPLCRYKQHRR
jgi:hypothetical protein